MMFLNCFPCLLVTALVHSAYGQFLKSVDTADDTSEENCPGIGYLHEKWTTWFLMEDLNQDGIRSVEDFTIWGSRIASGEQLSNLQRRELVANLRRAVQHKPTMDLAEYIEAKTTLYKKDPVAFTNTVKKSVQDVMRAAFQDKKTVSRQSFYIAMKAMGCKQADVLFDLLKVGGDFITVDALIDVSVDTLTNPCISTSPASTTLQSVLAANRKPSLVRLPMENLA